MLTKIVKIYISYSEYPEFISSICNEERSFSSDSLKNSCKLIEEIDKDLALKFTEVINKIEAKSKEMKVNITIDIPDEFLDPILMTLMKDPVLLPNSGIIVDRSTISRILLSDPIDPFNRSPLTIEQVKPAVELKNKIDNWLNLNQNKTN